MGIRLPKKFYHKRIIKLAELLEKDARKKKGISYNQTTFGRIGDPDNVLSCGTQACALGLAALSGAFKRAGLGYKIIPNNYGIHYGINFTWKSKAAEPITAAMKTFGITHEEAQILFGGSSGSAVHVGAVAERSVAKRLRNFVKMVRAKELPRNKVMARW